MNFTPSNETLKRRDGTIGASGFNERLKVDYKEGYRPFTSWRIRIINEYPLPRFYHPNLLIH